MTDNGFQWGLKHPIHSIGWHFVPKSEYRLCEPPEVWKDVTGECRVDDYSNRSGDFWSILHATTGANVMSKCNDSYRLRKVQFANRLTDPGWAFIVEQKVKS